MSSDHEGGGGVSPSVVGSVMIEEEDEECFDGDGDEQVEVNTNYEREVNDMGVITVSRGSLCIRMHAARRIETYVPLSLTHPLPLTSALIFGVK